MDVSILTSNESYENSWVVWKLARTLMDISKKGNESGQLKFGWQHLEPLVENTCDAHEIIQFHFKV